VSAVLALINADDQHHAALLAAFEVRPDESVLPWAILPVQGVGLETSRLTRGTRGPRRLGSWPPP
jgi:hypothetical protein